MESKKINQLATNVAPVSTDLTIIGDPITGVSKKITLLQLASIFSGSIAFYTNYAAFPATGTVNTIYCAKDTNKLYLWSGSAYVETFPSQALLDTYQLRSEKGVSNGYASLDSAGKVPISQLPSSIMEYKGMWSATTNTPTLANGTGDTGDVYICNGAGSVNFGAGAITFAVGDYVVYSGTIWQRSSGAVGTVTSVGLSTNGNSITIGSSPISTSGTITANFAGTSLQYINGAGNLVTFPTLLSSDNLVAVVRNQSGATMTAGTIVYISGATGNKPLISKALATGDSTSAQTYGFVQSDITNNADGYVVVIGNVNDLDTSALTEGQQLYLSGTTAGTYTTTKPYAPIHLVYVGIVLRSHPTQGIIGVKIQNGFEMDELHNVDAYLPNNNDILSYNTTTSLWEHKQIATTLGFTPISLASLSATSPIFYNSTTGVISSQAASATLEGYVTTGTQTIAGDKSFTGINSFDYGINYKTGASLANVSGYISQAYATSGTGAGSTLSLKISDGNSVKAINLDFVGSPATYTYTYPALSGTIALTSDLTSGTVTSVAALTLGTTGTDLSSTVANGTTTPVITLNVPTASATNRGALSSADWTTFNNKQAALTNPVTGTGTTNYLSKFTGASAIGNSLIWDNGTNVGIGNTNTSYTLDVSGTGYFSGIVGIGVAPSAWYNSSGYATLQVGNASLFGRNSANSELYLSSNAYDNTSGNPTYITTDFAARYVQNDGVHSWLTAPSGTAGTATTFTERMRITSAGNVGIGTSSPNARLSLGNTTSTAKLLLYDGGFTGSGGNGYFAGFAIDSPSANDTTLLSHYQGALVFGRYTNANDTSAITERMRITSGGNVGIGTMSPSYLLHAYSTDASTARIYLQGTTNFVATQFGNTGGAFYLGIDDSAGANFTGTAYGRFLYSSGAYPLVIATNGAERMRITSGGQVNINGSAASTQIKLAVLQTANNHTSYLYVNNGSGNANVYSRVDSTANVFSYFEYNGSIVGSITTNGTTTAYNITSDYRLKQDFKDFNGLDLISAIKTYDYEWKSDNTRMYGFIAHELSEILPYAVTGEKDAEMMQSVDYSKIVPILVKGMQEQQIQIQNLQEQINILAK